MGTRMAPTCANLFTGIFEQKYIFTENPFHNNITIYKRYIDDLFILWNGSEREALDFVTHLNSNTWGITFTSNIKKDKTNFLNISITHKNRNFITSTFFKKVETNSYLYFKVVITPNGKTTSRMDNLEEYQKIILRTKL